jgi:hypothetical protein
MDVFQTTLTQSLIQLKNDLELICKNIKEQPELANRQRLSVVIMAGNRVITYLGEQPMTTEQQRLIDDAFAYLNTIRAFCQQ